MPRAAQVRYPAWRMSLASVVSRIAHDTCVDEPVLLPEGDHWWEHLAPDFPELSEPFRLALRDRLQVRATAATDVVLRTLGACLVGVTAMPLGYGPEKLKQALADRSFYGPMAESGDATRFFESPPRGVQVKTARARFPRFRPPDGICNDLSFESPFVPANPRERGSYLRHRENRVARARHWRHEGGPRPTIMAIHGFSADLYLLNEWFFALPWLYRMGFDVCLVTLPFHGERQPRFSPFSGHGFFAGGINRINEAFAQGVYDFRIFLDHFQHTLGVREVGVTGVSLGGFTSGLLAAVEPRLRFAIANVPVASVPDLVHEWEPMGAIVRYAMKRHGLTLPDARHLLAVSCPLTYAPKLSRERLFVIGGVGDRLAPPKHTRLLWDHWGRGPIHWFPGSHLLHLDRGEYLREIGRFLRRIGFFDGLGPPALGR
ncbi:MAG: prolyl oligopeptidase family serine peptidase [Sandaracinaceae bacterium]